MFSINNVTLDYGRLTNENLHSHFTGSAFPTFGWSVLHGRKGAKQASVHIRCFSENKKVFWDSGKVATEDQQIKYAGEPLPEGEKILFSLSVTDDNGCVSNEYSDYIYNASCTDWNPKWIGLDEAEDEKVILLRKKISIKDNVKSARLYACGIGYQKVYIDGVQLDNSELDPSCTDYRKQCQYKFIPELQKMLSPGFHNFTARIAAGWRFNPGTIKLIGIKANFSGPKEFCAKLIVEYENGETDTICTDDTWDVAYDACSSASLFDGTVFDASSLIPDFMTDTSTDEWPQKAAVIPAPGGALKPMLIPSVERAKHRAAIASWPVEGKGRCFDFGQNMAGVVTVKFPEGLQKGQRIKITCAEEITDTGVPFRDTLRNAEATDIYIASGDSRDLAEWTPEFTYHGFRYALVEGLGEYYKGAEAVEVHTVLEKDSNFRCGNALVTRIHEMCVETERGNMHSILTDCPQRDERMQWLNDATVRFEEIPYNFEIGRMFPKVVEDIRNVQNDEGAIGCTAPFVYGAIPADPVCSSFLIAGYEAAMHTGNLDVIRDNYAGFKAWEECLLNNSEEYIVKYSYYGDWAGPEDACVQPEDGTPGAVSKVTPGVFMSSGYSYLNCRLLSLFAHWLGDSKDEAHYKEQAERIRTAILGKWYNPETAVIATGSQGAQAFALWLGILPENDRQKAAKVMRDNLAEANYKFTTGNLCTKCLLEMLCKYGYEDDALAMITREECPSFGFMLQQEATTIWERFELMKDSTMNSHNHPMYASVDYWMYSYLAGIKCKDFKWKRIEIEPHMPEKLLSCQAKVDTDMGDISVRWVKRYDSTIVYVDIPFGAEADLVLNGEHHILKNGFHVYKKCGADCGYTEI